MELVQMERKRYTPESASDRFRSSDGIEPIRGYMAGSLIRIQIE